MAVLALIRHGQSIWTRGNRFSGWADNLLSSRGRDEAHRVSRAIETLPLIKAEMQTPDSNTETSWLQNERSYGSLQGQSRREVHLHYSNKQVAAWRPVYRARPPFQRVDDPNYLSLDPKYQHVDRTDLPSGESLEDATIRVWRWWNKGIVPQLRLNQNVLVVAHTASLHGIARVLEKLDDTQTASFRIATCTPVVYEKHKT